MMHFINFNSLEPSGHYMCHPASRLYSCSSVVQVTVWCPPVSHVPPPYGICVITGIRCPSIPVYVIPPFLCYARKVPSLWAMVLTGGREVGAKILFWLCFLDSTIFGDAINHNSIFLMLFLLLFRTHIFKWNVY
jgi:hypothetical protein